MSEVIRMGLVGFGKIARDQHLPVIAETEGAELVAVASRNATAPGLRNYSALEDMLAAEPKLDAIILCQPPQVRFTAAWTAISAGKHVFLEKPPGATLSEVEALSALAQSKGVTLFASWHSREAAAVKPTRQWLEGKAIRAVRIDWKEDVRVWHPGQAWIWEPGGFGVFDPGINALSVLTAIMPEPVRVLSADLDIPVNCGAPIAARLSMAGASGIPIEAEFDFRQTGPQTWDIAIACDEGDLLLSHGANLLTINGKPRHVAQKQEYAGLYRHFVRLVGAGQSDVDLAPLRLVADAFLTGRTCPTEAFHD